MARFESLGLVKDYVSLEGYQVKSVTAKFVRDSAGYRLKFNFDPDLDNSVIKAIEVVDSTTASLNPQIKNDTSGDYLPNLSATDLAACLFVLAKGDEQIAVLPCVNLVKRLNGGKPAFFSSTYHRWSDSYIELVASGVVTAGTSVITLNVWYDPK